MDPASVIGPQRDLSRKVTSLRAERDAVALYPGRAGIERDPARADALGDLLGVQVT